MENKQSIWQQTSNNLKFSFNLAFRNLFSYLLAVIGIGIIFVIVAAAISIPIMVILFATIDLSQLGVAIPESTVMFNELYIIQSITEGNYLLGAAFGLIFAIPAIAIGTTFIGPLFGMSKELVESGDTSAENAFTWLRRKLVPFALAGIGAMLIMVVPPGIMYLITYYLLGITLPLLYQRILATVAGIWFFFAYGLIASVLPAVADGQSVNDSFKLSFNLARTHWKRVYGLLLGYAAIVVVLLGPAIIPALLWDPIFFTPPLVIDPLWIGVISYVSIGALILIFLGVPAHMISVTRLYMLLTGKETYEMSQADEPEISLMGG